MNNLDKYRRETIRWQILVTLNNARPIGCYESLVISVVQAEFPDCSNNELRREITYLETRNLVQVKREPDNRWKLDLERFGIDVVEYTVDCEPGIARPSKYHL